MERINVCNLFFSNLNMQEAINEIESIISIFNNHKENPHCIVFANQDVVVKFNTEKKELLNELNKNSIILPDGCSILLAAKILGKKLKERIAGPDFMIEFIKYSLKKNYKHFFLGSSIETLEKLQEKLKEKYKEIRIAGAYSPPFYKEFPHEENNKMIELINNSNADILWVSFGCPKQETWAIQNIKKLKVPIVACVGAAFNINAGLIKRAPIFIQKIGFEWFYRLLQEPKRLWKRYLIGGIIFLKLIVSQKIKVKT